jgi:WD repeat-containing protein 55
MHIMKGGRKVVCGTGQGVLALWSWGTWGDISDRFPGHPASVDALLKIDEDTLLTGSSDGLLRVVQILPDKFLGVLGDHEGFPIEHLQWNADKSLVGSVTHDKYIRLWDARILKDDYDPEDPEVSHRALAPHVEVPSADMQRASDEEWEDMDEDIEDEMKDSDDSDSDSVESQSNPNKRKNKREGRFKTPNEKFFEDL